MPCIRKTIVEKTTEIFIQNTTSTQDKSVIINNICIRYLFNDIKLILTAWIYSSVWFHMFLHNKINNKVTNEKYQAILWKSALKTFLTNLNVSIDLMGFNNFDNFKYIY